MNTPSTVTWFPHPFELEHEFHEAKANESVGDLYRRILDDDELLPCLYVTIDGEPIPQDRLSLEFPQHDSVIVGRLVPRGGGGGGGGKNILSIVIGVALIAASFFVPALAPEALAFIVTSSGIGTAIGGIGAAIALQGLAGLISPTPSVPNRQALPSSQGEARLVSTITGTSNRLNPYGPIPKVFGTIRFYPPLAAKFYTEIVGNDQYLRMVLAVGYKPLDILQADMKIGDTDLDDFDDIEVEIHSKDSDDDITLYTNSVVEDSLSVLLTQAGGYQSRTTALNTKTISLDFSFLRGLIEFDAQGNPGSRSVTVEIEYKLTSEPTTWTSAGTFVMSDATRSPVRRNKSIAVTAGEYDVRVKRNTADSTDTKVADETTWTVLRSIQDQTAVQNTDVALIALRIRASEQLTGVIENLSVLAKARYQVWNGSSWSEAQSNLAAWAYADQLINTRSNIAPLATTRLDADALKDWADADTTAGREFNFVLDADDTVYDSCQQIASGGRGSFHMQDGVYSVVRDKLQTVPVALITDRNSWDYEGELLFRKIPHALRVQFRNKDLDYVQDERIVYQDGYDVENATDIEELPLTGITNADQAYTEGRYHLAAMLLRPEIHRRSMDMENWRFNRGDLVRLQSQAALIGLSTARVSAVQTSGTDVTGVTLDDPVTMETGKSYGLDFRLSDFTRAQHDIDLNVGEQSTVVFSSVIPDTETQPAVGDLVVFGESGLETIECIVKSIEPLSDTNARISFLDAAPAVHSADSPIPAWSSAITVATPLKPVEPPVPTIEAINSDEFVMEFGPDGSLQSRIVVTLRLPSQSSAGNLYYQGQSRVSGVNGSWTSAALVPVDAGEVIFLNVKDTVTYEIRVRTTDGVVRASAWTSTVNHQVIGKTNPPPDVDTFMVERQADGTRKFTWTYLTPPPDLDGFLIKYKTGTGHVWADLAPILTDGTGRNLTQASPFETNLLAAGTYTIGIKAIDTSGNESTNAKIIQSTLGDPRIGGAILQRDEHNEGFPGTKTDCYVDSNGNLAASDTKDWADFALDGDTWADWTTWNRVPANPIVYESPGFDLGAILNFSLLVTVTGTGTPTITEAHSDTDSGYSSFAAITGQIEARWVKVKVSMADSDAIIENIIIIPDGTILEEIISDLDTSTISGGSAGDRRIPLMKTFSLITAVQVALQNVGDGWSWEIIDKSTSLGPRIKIYDGATLTDTDIDVVVKGIA